MSSPDPQDNRRGHTCTTLAKSDITSVPEGHFYFKKRTVNSFGKGLSNSKLSFHSIFIEECIDEKKIQLIFKYERSTLYLCVEVKLVLLIRNRF